MIQDILNIKDQLLNLKSGDTFKIDAWLFDGQRFYNVKVGSKWVFIKAIYGNSPRKRISRNKAKELFLKVYWGAAKIDSFYKNCRHFQALERKKARLPTNWEKEYK